MTVKALYDLRENNRWRDQVVKWYGPPLDEMTEGVSIRRLAQVLEEKEFNGSKSMVEQSIRFCDCDDLYYNLKEIDKQYSIPNRQHVLRLLMAFQVTLRNFKMSFKLLYMHQIFFPEDRALIDNAHNAGADETMTYKQACFFFCGTENRLKPAGIQVYFNEIDPIWNDHYLTKDSNGNLLLPSDFEVIRDIAGTVVNIRQLILQFRGMTLTEHLAPGFRS